MLLRPIDAIFVHPERRLYVVYYRGELWQLPRMKLDMAAWQRRQPYIGAKEALYLSQKQAIDDPLLAQKLRTLDLPLAIRGSTLPRFESWWEMNGYEWLKERLDNNSSPLAAHVENPVPAPIITENNITNNKKLAPTALVVTTDDKTEHKPTPVAADIPDSDPIDSSSSNNSNSTINDSDSNIKAETDMQTHTEAEAVDIFADMLAELADEVACYRQQ